MIFGCRLNGIDELIIHSSSCKLLDCPELSASFSIGRPGDELEGPVSAIGKVLSIGAGFGLGRN